MTSLLVVCAAGCTQGLSARETRTQNYSSFIMSLYDQPLQQAQPAALVAPMRVAIAQVGELGAAAGDAFAPANQAGAFYAG